MAPIATNLSLQPLLCQCALATNFSSSVGANGKNSGLGSKIPTNPAIRSDRVHIAVDMPSVNLNHDTHGAFANLD